MTERQLRAGKPCIWSTNGEHTKEENAESIAEFFDFTFNGLLPHYMYSHFVTAFREGNELPCEIGVCRGLDEAMKLFIMFSDCGLLCSIEKCTVTKRRVKNQIKVDNSTRKVLTEKAKNHE